MVKLLTWQKIYIIKRFVWHLKKMSLLGRSVPAHFAYCWFEFSNSNPIFRWFVTKRKQLKSLHKKLKSILLQIYTFFAAVVVCTSRCTASLSYKLTKYEVRVRKLLPASTKKCQTSVKSCLAFFYKNKL